MNAYVLSAGRCGNVPAMSSLLEGLPHAWLVPAAEVSEYQAAGATSVIAQDNPHGITGARNQALAHARKERAGVCVQLSDDMRRVQRLGDDGKAHPYTAASAARDLAQALDETGYGYAGCSPTANAFYAKDRIHRAAFIVGDFSAIDVTRPPLWFDEALPLKEDYDYTLQHYAWNGGVARCDWLLPTFRHRTNPGGAVAYRTAELEQEAIRILKTKWPAFVRDNPRRPNEILLRFPR